MAETSNEDAAMPYDPEDDEPQTVAEKVKQKHESRLISMDGVEGVGIGADTAGNDVLIVYVRDEAVKDRLPAKIDGVPVRGTTTGEIDAQ